MPLTFFTYKTITKYELVCPKDIILIVHINERQGHNKMSLCHLSVCQFSSVQFSHSVVSDSLWPYGLQHARLTCPSLSPRVCSNSSHCVNDAIQLSHPLASPSPFAVNFSQHQVLFNELALLIRWSKYWRFFFSSSTSNEYSGLISFRIELVWSPCSPSDSQESFPAP